MKLRVLGCDGGRGLGYTSTSLLFNEAVLIDAGTIQTELTLEEALKVSDIFLTHSHLDHLIDLPFLLDATFNKREKPLRIHGTKETLDTMMTYLFNDKIWPNFAKLPTADAGQFTLHDIKPEESYKVGELTFTPFSVNHTVDTVGYKIEDANASVVFSGDTGPTESVWAHANSADSLKAVIVDLSFPIKEQNIADISGHMTVDDVKSELTKLEADCQVYAFHFKVGLADILEAEMKKLSHAGKAVLPLRHYKEITF